jgi:hypothetical protein
MEMGFNHDVWPLRQGPGGESDGAHHELDWTGLRARFLAARACRQALGGGESRCDKAVDASFDRSAARALANFEDASQGVNLDNSADGKAQFGIGEDVASASMRGDRG